MENDTNNVNQENIPEVFSSNPQTGNEPVNVQPVEPTKKSNKWLVIIIVIILLALVGIGIYFF